MFFLRISLLVLGSHRSFCFSRRSLFINIDWRVKVTAVNDCGLGGQINVVLDWLEEAEHCKENSKDPVDFVLLLDMTNKLCLWRNDLLRRSFVFIDLCF